MASHIISNNSFGDSANVHNGNVYNNWTGSQAQIDSDAAYLHDLRITDPRLDKKRILDTKGPLLRDSYRWIFDHQDYQQWLNAQNGILWIKGDPGKGKTMLLCGIIESLKENEEIENEMAYFFCQATDSRINSAAAILGGLTFYLARRKRSLLSYVRERHLSPGKPLFDGPNGWFTICDIFEAILQDSGWSRLVLVVDALDECVLNRDHFLRLVVRTSSKVKWLLSSRNLEDIQRRLLSKETVNPLSLELKENAESVSQAVQTYIDHCVAHMEIIQDDKELENKVRDILQRKADNTFLWAALAIQQLQDAMKWEVLQILDQMPEGLQSLYQLMMSQIQDHPIQRRDLCIKLLSIVTTAYRPLHLGELSSLWNIEPECPQSQEDVRTVARLCGSFLTVKDDTIYFIHQSAKDFVIQQSSQASITSKHFFMFKSSIDVMSKNLHRNMYGLESPSTRVDEITTPCPDSLACLRYQCIFWIDHLLATSEEERAETMQNHGSLYLFFTNVYLYWLEATSLLQATNHTIEAIYKLSALTNQHTPGLKGLIEDAIRFFQSNRGAIEIVPLQIYSSALAFAPKCSAIRQEFEGTIRQDIPLVLNRPNTWGARVHTLLGHRGAVTSLEFSPTSRLLVSGSEDGTARIWELETGNCQQILHFGTHHHLVKMSPNLKTVASSDSKMVYIWNTATGKMIHTLHDEGRRFKSIAFASDSKLLASAYRDKTVRIWCTETGKLLRTLQDPAGECGDIRNVAFSPDVRYVVGAGDSAATIWDIKSANELCNSIRQEETNLAAVVFSPNSKLLASAHWPLLYGPKDLRSCISVWCSATGRKLQSCRTKFEIWSIKRLAFVSSAELVVPTEGGLCYWRFQSSSDFDKEILVSGLSSLPGLRTIDFSFDMAFFAKSETNSNTISIWQLNSINNNADAFSEDGSSIYGIHRVAISPDSSVVASGSFDATVTLWRTDTGQRYQTFTGHTYEVTGITFSHDSSIMITSDKQRTLRLWQIATGKCINVLSVLELERTYYLSFATSDHLSQIAVSADLGIIACGCDINIFVLRKNNDEHYECIAEHPAPKKEDKMIGIEHIAVSFDSVFVTWKVQDDFRLNKDHEFVREHWRIDMDHPSELHVGDRYRSVSYQEKRNGFLIPRGLKWLLTPTGQYAWVTQKEKQLLWIPKQFRPHRESSWDSLGSILAIAVNSDFVLIIDFSRQPDAVAYEDGEIKILKRKRRGSSLGYYDREDVARA